MTAPFIKALLLTRSKVDLMTQIYCQLRLKFGRYRFFNCYYFFLDWVQHFPAFIASEVSKSNGL